MTDERLYQALGAAVVARANCQKTGNYEWEGKWSDKIKAYLGLLREDRAMDEQKQGLINFATNVKPIMLRVKSAIDAGKGQPANLTLREENSILQFYLEVVDYLSK